MTAIDANMVREALADLPDETSYGELPEPEYVYLPRSHVNAVDPNTLLVTGMRGAGKTFWWNALQISAVRQLVGQSTRKSSLGEGTEARTGFGSPFTGRLPKQRHIAGSDGRWRRSEDHLAYGTSSAACT